MEMERTMDSAAAPTRTNYRWKVASLIFLVSFVAYMDRVNLSVATPVIMQEFGFNKIDMGFLQTCFFAGYALMQVPGGILADRFGLRKTGTFAILWWSLFTGLTAFAQGKFSFAASRLAFGLGEGPVFPSHRNACYKWFHHDEKGKASSAVLGGTFFGPVVGPIATVVLMGWLGWQGVFIAFGIIGALVAYAWHRYTRDDLKDCPYVSEEEVAYINEARGEHTEKAVAPWKRLLTNHRFWAVGLQFLVVDYIMYVFLAWLPMFLTEVYGLNLKSMGFWTAVPWIALTAMVFFSGWLSDRLAMGKNSARQYTMRTATAIAGIVVTSLGLYAASQMASVEAAIFWMTVALGALGFCMSATWSSVMSLGGRFSGSVSGWINLWGNIGGVLAPVVTAFLVEAYGWSTALAPSAPLGSIVVVSWLLVKPGKQLLED